MKIRRQAHRWANALSYISERGVREAKHRGGVARKSIFEISGGEPVLLKKTRVELTDSKEGKPFGMQTHISRRPIYFSDPNCVEFPNKKRK